MKMNAILLSKQMLKVHALVLGFLVWYIISQNHIESISKTVPLCFYNQPKNTQLDAPETIKITGYGPKSHLNQCFHSDYAVHVNLQSYQLGSHEIEISHENLFLPTTIKLLQLKPSILQIKIT